jgi:hypothetical protein
MILKARTKACRRAISRLAERSRVLRVTSGNCVKSAISVCVFLPLNANAEGKVPESEIRCATTLSIEGFDYSANSLHRELYEAVRRNNDEATKKLLARVTDVNFLVPLSVSLLYVAVMNRNIQIIEWLFDKGANVNFVGCGGSYFEALAIGYTNHKDRSAIPIAELLLRRGVDVNQAWPATESEQREKWPYAPISGTNLPMHYAAQLGDVEFMQWLYKHGVAVDLRDRAGKTPLLRAILPNRRSDIKKRRLEVVRQLLDWGADPNASFEHIGPPIDTAIDDEDPELVKLFVEHGANLRLKDGLGNSVVEHLKYVSDFPVHAEPAAQESLKEIDGILEAATTR